jgi:hypothetical protein
MRPLFKNIANLLAAAFSSITGSRGIHGKPINPSSFEVFRPSSYAINGNNIDIRRSCRTTNQRKRRKHFRAQLANGSV